MTRARRIALALYRRKHRPYSSTLSVVWDGPIQHCIYLPPGSAFYYGGAPAHVIR